MHFLPLDEAARVLGVSRLTVRDAVARGVVPGRRDNQGRLRVDLGEGAEALLERLRAAGPPSAGAVDGLFDEIEELSDALAERDERLARAEALLERQDAALGRATAALEAGGAGPDSDPGSGAREGGVSRELADRTLAALERAVERLEASEAREHRLAGLLERAEVPMERALAAAEEARRASEAQEGRLHETEAALERALALGERALAAREERGRWRLFRRRDGR